MINPKEAPYGMYAAKMESFIDCKGCCLEDKPKQCKKAKCNASFREDKSEVIFKYIG